MYNLTDNRRGVVYILDQFDPATQQFKKVTKYLSGLRNPNSVAFYTDRYGTNWFYLALTDRLVRYRYEAGKDAPSGEPEVLATFPDYGLGYKYGGWHLTRTVIVGGNGKIYVAVGSSCNACEEKEEVRATILEMDPDGKNQRYFARGLRNAVGLRWTNGKLYATNMGSDHLGDNRPADTFYAIEDGKHYGWPYCFQAGARIYSDPKFNAGGRNLIAAKCLRRSRRFRRTARHSDWSTSTRTMLPIWRIVSRRVAWIDKEELAARLSCRTNFVNPGAHGRFHHRLFRSGPRSTAAPPTFSVSARTRFC